MRLLIAGCLVALVSGASNAQVLTDPFNYAGTMLGTWQEVRGDWTANGTEAIAANTGNCTYLIDPNVSMFEGCIQCVVKYNAASTLGGGNGGLVLRANDAGGGAAGCGRSLVYLAARSANGGIASFDSFELSSVGSQRTVFRSTSFGAVAQVTYRAYVLNNRVTAQVDVNGDGVWDFGRSGTILWTENHVAGSIGAMGANGVIIDDFKYYDGIVVDAGVTNPGSPHALTLHGQPNATYQAACSLGNGGFPIGGGRRLPLDPDGMFLASVLGFLPATFQSFTGVMDGNGVAGITVNVPPGNALIGLHWFTGFVNIGPAGITVIGAEASTKIV